MYFDSGSAIQGKPSSELGGQGHLYILCRHRHCLGTRLPPSLCLTCDDQFWVEKAGVLLQLVIVDVASVWVHLWESGRHRLSCFLW